MQSIQALATFQYQCNKQGAEGYGKSLAIPLFNYICEKLLQILLYPNMSDYGISWDRLDSFAIALLSIIVLDYNFFMQCAQIIIQSQPDMIRNELLNSFTLLTTARNIEFNKVDRKSKQIFIQNMRDFYNQVKPLVIFHE